MEVGHHELDKIVILLLVSIVVISLFHKMRLSPVLGFLLAGAAIGPYGYNLVENIGRDSIWAELGVIFLLFVIGIELSFDRLKSIRKYIFGIGLLQMLITSALFSFMLSFVIDSWALAVVFGSALSLSSTAIVMQEITERAEQHTIVGKISFSVLLLQDLAVVPLLVVLPVLASGSGDVAGELLWTSGKAVVAVAAIILIGRLVLNPFFRFVAKTKRPELFSGTAFFVALGSAWVTETAGLSLALGAFLAGLMVAETKFQKQVETDVLPFKSLFMGLFFLAVGMGIDIPALSKDIWLALGLTISFVALKAAVIFILCLFQRISTSGALQISLLLCQCSEFAFVLLGLGMDSKVLPESTGNLLLLVVTITMAVTPVLVWFAKKMALKVGQKMSESGTTKEQEFTSSLHDHYVICGFGWVGEKVAKLLSENNISFVAIDDQTIKVANGRKKGYPVYYGNAERAELLKSLNAEKSKGVIIAVEDFDHAVEIIKTVEAAFHGVDIIARAKDIQEMKVMEQHGATLVIPEVFESFYHMAEEILHSAGYEAEEIQDVIDKNRELDTI